MPANWAQATRYFHSSLAVLCNVPFLQSMVIWVVEFPSKEYKIRYILAQTSMSSKEIILFRALTQEQDLKKFQNLTFKVIFYVKNPQIFFSFKNINLGAHFFVKGVF